MAWYRMTGSGELHGAVISCITNETSLIGTIATLSLNNEVVDSVPINSDLTFSFNDIEVAGNYTITISDGSTTSSKDVEITAEHIVNKTIVSLSIDLLNIVTFANGTDEEITKMIEAHYVGQININDYWSVGDTRSISITSIPSGTTGEEQPSQTIQLVILDFNHDDLDTPINGKTKSALTVQTKNCLNTVGYMNASYDSPNYALWSTSQRRSWCNNKFKNALPSWLSSLIKPVIKKSNRYYYNSSTNGEQTTTTDSVFLLSEAEAFGVRYNNNDSDYMKKTMDFDGVQYEYMKTQSNRIKTINGNNRLYLSRTSYIAFDNKSAAFVVVDTDGKHSAMYALSTQGIAPVFNL